ncbi:MAG: Pvc16 family protein [Methylococcaceae bacterium]
MSSALAIAGVTAVLRDLINDAFVENDVSGIVGGNVVVSALAPDRVLVNGSLDQPQLNIYMYLVTPNTGWRNECLPSRNSNGQRTNNPFLALNLHYLLTAYGDEDLHAEILLAHLRDLYLQYPVISIS